jgi:voltage-gated potassium channel
MHEELKPLRVRRRDLRTPILYIWTLLNEFKGTLIALLVAVLLGGTLYALTPHKEFDGNPPPMLDCFLGAWLALFAQPIFTPPATWYLAILVGVYPLLGFGLIGEGIVRLAMLLVSRKHSEKEWMNVKASTYRNHVVLCGLGHLGYRILIQLLKSGAEVVAIEKEADGRFVADAKATGTPVLVRDMKEDQALVDAGIHHARVIVIASDNDLANLEVALDARRMNPSIRVVMRMFDQQIADKFKDAELIDEAFSSAALAAPIVADLALRQYGERTASPSTRA